MIFYESPPPIETFSKNVGFVVFPVRGDVNAKTIVIEQKWNDFAAITIKHNLPFAYLEEYSITIWGPSLDHIRNQIDDLIKKQVSITSTNPKNNWQKTTLTPMPWQVGHIIVEQRKGLRTDRLEYANDLLLALTAYRDA